MTTTLENITTELLGSYSHSLTERDSINNLLDHINDKKTQYREITQGLKKLSDLLSKITWLDNIDNSDEVIIKGLITMGKEADNQFKKYYSSEKREYASKGWFKEEFKNWKEAIYLHIETVLEVEHIIFELRKDSEFNDLCDLINEL